MYAVVGIWQRDEQQSEAQLQFLRERIVPNVGRSPGFVAGYWTHDHSTGKDHTMIVLDSEAAALAFKDGVEGNSRNQTAYGVTMELLTVVEVLAALPSGVEQYQR